MSSGPWCGRGDRLAEDAVDDIREVPLEATERLFAAVTSFLFLRFIGGGDEAEAESLAVGSLDEWKICPSALCWRMRKLLPRMLTMWQ